MDTNLENLNKRRKILAFTAAIRELSAASLDPDIIESINWLTSGIDNIAESLAEDKCEEITKKFKKFSNFS